MNAKHGQAAHQLDDHMLVSRQIAPEDVPELQRLGVTMIVNNRSDHEDPGQPLGADIEAAAKAAGVEYRYVPIVRGIGPSDVEAMRHAMRECGDGKLLAFCRSGTRSTLVWAVARAEGGASRDELDRCAAAAGVDLSPVHHLL
ncbi:MAG: TIGR01244 family phosphatase [Sphingomonas sp.]|nr:TIGR01244 family phosphatase [Sphingomonas sp.]